MKNKFVLLAPFVLIVTTAFVFRVSSLLFGTDWATIIGFSFYQLVWCIIFPLVVLGKGEVLHLFRQQEVLSRKESSINLFLLVLTVVGAIPLFIGYLAEYSLVILLLGIPLTIINGVCEEIFWRGVYMRTFKENTFLAVFYPSVLFAVWHLSPELAHQTVNLTNVVPFVLLTLPLGFIYSFVAFRTKSIKWVAIAHSLSGILAFGIPLSTSFARILGFE